MPYLNIETGDYPRFSSDVSRTPRAAWVVVEETVPPMLGKRDALIEGEPVMDAEGAYRQTWIVTELTDSELEERESAFARSRSASLGLMVGDLKSLAAEGA